MLLLATALTLSACGGENPNNAVAEQEAAAATAARDREINEFRERANSLDNPDEVLALRAGKGNFTAEASIVNDRLTTLVGPRIAEAESIRELRELKKYTLPGSQLVMPYMRRDTELTAAK